MLLINDEGGNRRARVTAQSSGAPDKSETSSGGGLAATGSAASAGTGAAGARAGGEHRTIGWVGFCEGDKGGDLPTATWFSNETRCRRKNTFTCTRHSAHRHHLSAARVGAPGNQPAAMVTTAANRPAARVATAAATVPAATQAGVLATASRATPTTDTAALKATTETPHFRSAPATDRMVPHHLQLTPQPCGNRHCEAVPRHQRPAAPAWGATTDRRANWQEVAGTKSASAQATPAMSSRNRPDLRRHGRPSRRRRHHHHPNRHRDHPNRHRDQYRARPSQAHSFVHAIGSRHVSSPSPAQVRQGALRWPGPTRRENW